MSDCLLVDGNFGNPASRSHVFGWKAEEAVENARRQVADLVNADPREIVWTSGATDKIEHKAVLDTMRQLEREGFEVTYLEPTEDGLITPAMIEAVLRDDTILVSIMHVNNEIGTVNDIAAIGELTRRAPGRAVRQRQHDRPRTAQPEPEFQLRRRRVADHGAQGPRGVVRFCVHFGFPGAVLRAARPGSQ
nr:cysteine desulfurase [Tanacetum cinerariifolium]